MTVRKPRTRPAQMTEEQRALYDRIAGGPRSAESAFPLVDDQGALTGPFDAMLLQPGIGDALQALGTALRFKGQLTDRAREIAILLVAHFHRSGFEVMAHEAVGRRIGLLEMELTDLAALRIPTSATAYESAVATVVMRLLRDSDLADNLYEEAVATLGEAVLFEINTIVGYYTLLAVQLKLFRVGV